MTWTIKARRFGTQIAVAIANTSALGSLGPFAVRLLPSQRSALVRVEKLTSGTDPITVSLADPSFLTLYASAELLNEADMIERVHSVPVT